MPELSTVRVIKDRGAVDVSVLLREGVIVNLEIGRWRAEERIRPEDIGLEGIDPAQLRKYLQLGKKTLIPAELQNKLRTIENCARIARLKYSFDSPFGRFVPAGSFEALDEEMKRYETQWFEMCNLLCDHLKAHQKELSEGYQELAKEVYEQMRVRGHRDKDRYARRYARRVIAAIPTVEEIRASFRFEFQVLKVPEITVLDSKIRERILTEEASLEKLKTIRQSEERVRVMNERVAERMEHKRAETIDKFLNNLNTQVRQIVYDVAVSAKASLQKNGLLIGKTSAQLKNAIERFRMLNVLNDSNIEEHLKEVESLIKPIHGTSKAAKEEAAKRSKDLTLVLDSLRREARDLSLDLEIPEQTRTVQEDILGGDFGLDMDREARAARPDLGLD